jgi:hypothetical protein
VTSVQKRAEELDGETAVDDDEAGEESDTAGPVTSQP